jgi:3-deoxy-D-manno-octulosonic-acid transferase
MSYSLLTFLLWPLLLVYTLKIAWRDRSLRYLKQRLGFNYHNIKCDLWIHCASVGEVNTYLPLHKKLLAQYPDMQFLITTNTTTGAQTLQRHQPDRTGHCYLPIESGYAIKRFLKAAQPQQCLIMETELWPLLYRQCAKNNIDITIINARLSHKTLGANKWLRRLYRNTLRHVHKILCKSADEYQHYLQLGASEAQLEVVGNLKFAIEAQTDLPSAQLAEQLGQRSYCVAASTHHNEEQQLARLWQQLNTSHLLVIVPRHPNRSAQIQKQLDELQINYAVRSKQQRVNENTQVYLADTLGELRQFIAGARCVFIGGSLIDHGGQNILEAASAGKAIICGPYMYNFNEELQLLLSHQACVQVNNIQQLQQTIQNLLNDDDQLNALQNNARQVMQQQADISQAYLSRLQLS